ncbi:MAG: 4-hydroxy-tetrahydrodipicolinate synthase [Rhodospirillaceae bacterium]
MSIAGAYPGLSAGHIPFSLRGRSVVAVPTPFRRGRIDEGALAALCSRQVNAGTSAIVVCGTTGEAPALSHDEQRRVIEIAVDTVQERIPIIAGAGTASTAASVALALQAEQAGAAALLCVTPYYVRPTQDGIIRHMHAIHDAVRIPIILYDVPGRTGCGLTDETIVTLSRTERFVGLKDAAADAGRQSRLRPQVKPGFLMLSGDDTTQARHRRAGGDGCISVTANIAPALCARMHEAWDRGDAALFTTIADALAPLSLALFLESNPIPVKYALHQLGLMSGELRLPLTQLSPAHGEVLMSSVERIMALESQAQPAAGLRLSPLSVRPPILAAAGG